MTVRSAVTGLLWLVMCVSLGAANNRRLSNEPKIDVQVGGFGKVSAADIAAVLESAMSEILRYCPRARLSGFRVYHRKDHPQTNFKRQRDGCVAVGLTARNTYWAQYSFQFGHEFCHALANFSDNPARLARYPRHANSWLEESLCETASLFTLRAMSHTWKKDPPYPAWRSYARWLDAYARQRISQPEHQLPAGMSFFAWFKRNEAALRRNPAMRDRNTIVAIQLLPLFESEPRGWRTLTFLNRGSLDLNGSLAQHLETWRSQCPNELRPFLRRLAAVFAVDL